MANYDDFLTKLRNANPIETLIGSYVSLKRRGRNYVCNCPFHSERTPSFTVFTDTQSFYCFGCGSGGDVITFVMKSENLDFTEATKFLAEKSGIDIPDKKSGNTINSKKRDRIYEMNRLSANFFYMNLVKGKDKSGLQYFYDRRLTPQTIKKYGLGYSSDSWNELTDMLSSKGFTDDEIIEAWLGGRSRKTGKIFDMFRKRVMFPIVDLRGNIIGFGGRVLDDSKPKYLNTGATPVFDKGKNLFSLNFAKNPDSKRLILCEGYMDVIAVNQAGFENVVATLGTAITPDQARLMSHYANEVIIAYDSDGAGQNATQKAIRHFSDAGVQTRILHMDGAKDPDEYIKKFGADRFRMLIDNSGEANNFMLDNCEKGLDINSEAGKIELLDRISKFISGMKNPIERQVYISRMAKKYDFPINVLEDYIEGLVKKNTNIQENNEWRAVKSQTIAPKDEINPEAVKFRKEAAAEEQIICYLLERPEDYRAVEAEAPSDIFVTSFNKKVYISLLNAMKSIENFSLSLLNSEFSTDEMGKIIGITARNRDLIINHEVFADCADVLKNHRKFAGENNISDDDLLSAFKSKKH
ncbi:MAG: DNA primase [Ruminococcus flavefaciens]|nr:DNA primase [Ruminococcus flavefaciens]MCM1231408.1 DNA primase [Ruminococcus flavefaciens]